MARRGQPDVELAERTYIECWDQFQTWASRHTSKVLRFDPPADLDGDEEAPDESLFHAGSRNHTVREEEKELRASYYDPVEIDLEDELLEPTRAPISTHWLNTFTTEPIPQYSSFSHIRQHNLIRGDVWIQTTTGERIRVASIDDDEAEGDDGSGDGKKSDGRGKPKKDDKEKEPPVEIKEGLMDAVEARRHVRSRTLVNLGEGDHLAINQESMPFIPPEMKRRNMKETLASYEGSFIDIEAWQHFSANWDNDEDIIGAETVRRLIHIHQMTEERIDRTKVIPQDIRRLYSFLRHRTYPNLNTIFPRDPSLPRLRLDEWSQKDEQATLESRIREKAFNICSKINCQGVMCHTHSAARERALTEQEAHETSEAQENDVVIRRGRGPQTPRWEKPKLSAHRLFAKFKRERRTRCGDSCFSSFPLEVPEPGDTSIDVIESDSDPDARTQADIETIWKVDPDAIPCDVAELSWDKVTCRQAYDIRNKLYSNLAELEPDEDNPGIEERRGGHSGGQIILIALAMLKTDTVFGAASATQIVNTVARGAVAGQPRKPTLAKLRAANASDTDWSATRMCAKDVKPEVCSKVSESALTLLINVRRWSPLYERLNFDEAMEAHDCETQPVRKRPVPRRHRNSERSYIWQVSRNTTSTNTHHSSVDYTGDICFPRTSCRRSLIAEATHRNYLFDIPNYMRLSIDAGYTGNESRFANHPSNGNANCAAKYMWVGNDKHIALYATGHIWNSELFLNYGGKFWNSEIPGEGDDQGEQGPEGESSDIEIYDDDEGVQGGEDEDEQTSETSADL